MSELGSTSNVSSSAAQVDFLELCKLDVKCIQNLVVGGALLNRRQCRDLSSKLSQTILNVQELLVYCGASSVLFRPALGNLYRHLEKAKALVSECAGKDWCAAAVFQCRNENAFREILLDVGFCYNAIHELAKSKSKDSCDPPQDLRKSSILEAASDSDVDGDKQDLQKRLNELANGHTSFKPSDYIIPGRVAQKQGVAQRQSLANHLLLKMYWASKELQARTLEPYTGIMWRKASEPAGTWGKSDFLGSGSGANGVCSTTWLGIPCAKKVFHGDESESSFMKEAGIFAHLKHPCIVNFICCANGSEKGDRFIAMELMEMSLFDLIEKWKRKGEHFSVGVAVDVMVQMARGVCYLHGEGVAHRDLKPHNVVINKINGPHEVDHYCVKLVDFGMSKGEVEVSKSNIMTCRGIGTTRYSAPEAHPKANPGGGGKVNWLRADAFSFAMTCAHLLCLEAPLESTVPNELFNELTKNGRRPMIPDMYPKDLVLLLKDCWKTNPRSRPSFVEICERLEEFCYKYMKSYSSSLDGDLEDDGHDYNEGLKFIKMKLKSSNNHPLNDGAKDESDNNDYVSIISCTCGCTLQHLPQRPSTYGGGAQCDICMQAIVGEEYHCEACKFDAHPHCVEIQDEVEVSFLQLFKQGLELPKAPNQPPDFLDLCEHSVQSIEEPVKAGGLLNQRQCQDLSSKLSQTTLNVRKLIECCGVSAGVFRPALKNLYRCLEKAKALVANCGEEKWWVAAIFQIRNQNAFREILLEVSLGYHVIYEHAKSKFKDWNHETPDDLRSIFVPANASDVHDDQQDLQTRLEDLASDPSSVIFEGHSLPEDVALKAQSLARYLLEMQCALEQSNLATTLDKCNGIMWNTETEPPGTWGQSHYLGSGATDGLVWSTEWLDIPCAKKDYHVKEDEVFFLKEAGILAHSKHPCIIDLICCSNGQARGDRFIAMELMEKNLYDLIKDQGVAYFPLPVGVDIIVQIARGMSYLHDHGVAHRDLKPQNVVVTRLVSPSLEDLHCVKLVDFGTSKTKVDVLKSTTMTASGIGTTMYRAPELHPKANLHRKGRAMWMKADVFSFAMTCVHILTLDVPFKDITSERMYNAVMNGHRPKLPKDCPWELVALLKDCWNTIPYKRPSFMEICVRLETFRYKDSRGCLIKEMELGSSLDFIKTKIEEQSSFYKNPQKALLVGKDNELEDERNNNDYVSIMACTCGCTLQHLPQPPSTYGGGAQCDICMQAIVGEEYHCEACKFDAHPHCVEIQDEVEVPFHNHILHLLVEDYYMDKLDVTCYLCEESVQQSKWVYQCEPCDIDVHALCTKIPKDCEQFYHRHAITLRPCPPGKSLTCTCCNGEVKEYTWCYACSNGRCAIYLHPLCSICPRNPLCIFGTSHRLALETKKRSFYCARCGVLGASWSYHCKTCDVDIHVDCLDCMDEAKEDKWIRAYETFMLEDESKDHYTKMNMLLELVDKVPISNALEGGSSSTSYLPQVITRAQPLIQRLTLTDELSLNALDNDVDLQRQIVGETKDRIKAKKIAAKKARQKLSTNFLEMLEKLENTIVNVHSSGSNMSQDEVQTIAATHEELKRKQHLVKDQMAMQVQSKMGQGPRIVVFSTLTKEDGIWKSKLLTNLQGDMEKVLFYVLCEEPNHEHILLNHSNTYLSKFGKERAEKLQPFLASGLDAVRRGLSTVEPHELKFGLASVNIPCLGLRYPWDLRAMEVYENRIMDPCDDAKKVEELKGDEDSAAEWFQNCLENEGDSMLETYGLHCVRYKLTSRKDEGNKHKHSDIAWICRDHVNFGLEDGRVELFPLKYYNAKDDHLLRLPFMRF